MVQIHWASIVGFFSALLPYQDALILGALAWFSKHMTVNHLHPEPNNVEKNKIIGSDLSFLGISVSAITWAQHMCILGFICIFFNYWIWFGLYKWAHRLQFYNKMIKSWESLKYREKFNVVFIMVVLPAAIGLVTYFGTIVINLDWSKLL